MRLRAISVLFLSLLQVQGTASAATTTTTTSSSSVCSTPARAGVPHRLEYTGLNLTGPFEWRTVTAGGNVTVVNCTLCDGCDSTIPLEPDTVECFLYPAQNDSSSSPSSSSTSTTSSSTTTSSSSSSPSTSSSSSSPSSYKATLLLGKVAFHKEATTWSWYDNDRRLGECDLKVYSFEAVPTCSRVEADDLGTEIEWSCHVRRVFPEIGCLVGYGSNENTNVTSLSRSLTVTNNESVGDQGFYDSTCTIRVSMAAMGFGKNTFRMYLYPDIPGGRSLVKERTSGEFFIIGAQVDESIDDDDDDNDDDNGLGTAAIVGTSLGVGLFMGVACLCLGYQVGIRRSRPRPRSIREASTDNEKGRAENPSSFDQDTKGDYDGLRMPTRVDGGGKETACQQPVTPSSTPSGTSVQEQQQQQHHHPQQQQHQQQQRRRRQDEPEENVYSNEGNNDEESNEMIYMNQGQLNARLAPVTAVTTGGGGRGRDGGGGGGGGFVYDIPPPSPHIKSYPYDSPAQRRRIREEQQNNDMKYDNSHEVDVGDDVDVQDVYEVPSSLAGENGNVEEKQCYYMGEDSGGITDSRAPENGEDYLAPNDLYEITSPIDDEECSGEGAEYFNT